MWWFRSSMLNRTAHASAALHNCIPLLLLRDLGAPIIDSELPHAALRSSSRDRWSDVQSPQLHFPFQSLAHSSSLEAVAASSGCVHAVVRAEGRVEMQRLYYLKQLVCREGQTPEGRFTVQPNTTAGDQHFNKQEERRPN